jgi:hypothetical protein
VLPHDESIVSICIFIQHNNTIPCDTLFYLFLPNEAHLDHDGSEVIVGKNIIEKNMGNHPHNHPPVLTNEIKNVFEQGGSFLMHFIAVFF